MFIPKKVYIEKEALDYKLGKELQRQFLEHGVPVEILENNRVNFLRGKTPQEKYETGKRVTINFHSLPDALENVSTAI